VIKRPYANDIQTARVAVHFKSPRARKNEGAFYELLRNIEVCETDGISSELHLNQDGKDIKVELSKSELHLQESDTKLTVYVPRDAQAQYLCFLDRVPRALLEWMMTEPATGICEALSERALNVTHRILQAQREYIGLTLDRAGIRSIDTPEADLEATEAEDFAHISHVRNEETSPIEQTRQGGENDSRWDARSSTLYEASVVSVDAEEIIDPFSTTPRASSRVVNHHMLTSQRTASPRLLLSMQPHAGNQKEREYRRLLDSVVDAARRADFPSRGRFDMAPLTQALPTPDHLNGNELHWLRTIEKFERDKMIGAAGELFVSNKGPWMNNMVNKSNVKL
jgi:hypothetical protein